MFTYKIPIRQDFHNKDLSPEIVSETFSSSIIQHVQFICYKARKVGPCKMCSLLSKYNVWLTMY